MHSSREDGVEDTSEESINDEDDDDDEDGGGSGSASVRMLPLNPSSLSNHHRKSFPPAKVFRPTPPSTWKAADEMIGVSVPRKARSGKIRKTISIQKRSLNSPCSDALIFLLIFSVCVRSVYEEVARMLGFERQRNLGGAKSPTAVDLPCEGGLAFVF